MARKIRNIFGELLDGINVMKRYRQGKATLRTHRLSQRALANSRPPPSMTQFRELIDEARKIARKVGLKKADISEAIKKVRSRK